MTSNGEPSFYDELRARGIDPDKPQKPVIGFHELVKPVDVMDEVDEQGYKTGKKLTKYRLSHTKASDTFSNTFYLKLNEAEYGDKHPAIYIYQPNSGIWDANGAEPLKDLIYNIAGDVANERGVREILNATKAKLSKAAFNPNPFHFPAQDGILELDTGSFRSYRPEDSFTFKYGASYNVDNVEADYRPFLWFLCTIFPHPLDALIAIDIITSVALRVPFALIVLFFGLGNNGKGIFEQVLTALYTENRTTAFDLTEVKRSLFAKSNLLDADLWIASEVENVAQVINVVKSLVTADLIDSDVKYKNKRRKGRPHVKLIFDANTPFDFGDASFGRKRRVVKLDFTYQFGEGEDQRPEDPLLEEKLTKPEVLAGILRLIMARAPGLIKTRKVYRRKSIEEQEAEYDIQRFTLNNFCKNCLSKNEEDLPDDLRRKFYDGHSRIKVSDLYNEYVTYCSLFNVTPAADQQLGDYVSKAYGVSSIVSSTRDPETKKPKSCRYYFGIYLIKTAKLAYAEHKMYYTYYGCTTAVLHPWIEEITISKDCTTGTTTKRDILIEIVKMYEYINSQENPRNILYSNYVKNAVVRVVHDQQIAEFFDPRKIVFIPAVVRVVHPEDNDSSIEEELDKDIEAFNLSKVLDPEDPGEDKISPLADPENKPPTPPVDPSSRPAVDSAKEAADKYAATIAQAIKDIREAKERDRLKGGS